MSAGDRSQARVEPSMSVMTKVTMPVGSAKPAAVGVASSLIRSLTYSGVPALRGPVSLIGAIVDPGGGGYIGQMADAVVTAWRCLSGGADEVGSARGPGGIAPGEPDHPVEQRRLGRDRDRRAEDAVTHRLLPGLGQGGEEAVHDLEQVAVHRVGLPAGPGDVPPVDDHFVQRDEARDLPGQVDPAG